MEIENAITQKEASWTQPHLYATKELKVKAGSDREEISVSCRPLIHPIKNSHQETISTISKTTGTMLNVQEMTVLELKSAYSYLMKN